jgi:Uma2 family endonuclease
MATVVRKKPVSQAVDTDQLVVLRGVSWADYRRMLKMRGDCSLLRMVYLDEDLYLMSPAYPHERIKHRLGYLFERIVTALQLPGKPMLQTTFRRRSKRGGVEEDQAYYLAKEPKVRQKDKLNLKVDPPPDLAIAAVWTHDAAAALEVYRRLRVPEVWFCDGSELQILSLQADQ